MQIIEVLSPKDIKEFLEFPARLNRNDPSYIRPLDGDIEAVFDPKKNRALKKGTAARFLFKDEKGNTLGKIAVFINPKYKQNIPTGGIGFFDSIDNQEVADFIFNHAIAWLKDRGMQAVDGPINLGERDKFWGLLIDGFSDPLYGMNYNPPYYQKLFENFGFKQYFKQLCFTRPVHSEVSRRFLVMHEKHSRNPKISARPLKKNKLEEFAQDFTTIYNKAWATHGEGKQMELAKTLKMFKTMKPIINEHISWFVYHENEPIAMWINIPDLNQWFKYLNGKFGLWEKLKFLFIKRFKTNTKMVGIVFGVIPSWQKTGIDGYMIWEGTKHLRKHTAFTHTELQWIGDFNPKMIGIAQTLDTTVTRTLATYRYIFDPSVKFERHPSL